MFTVLTEQLYKALQTVGRAVSTKTTLPVLNNVLLSADGDRLKLAATNLEISITLFLDGNGKGQWSTTVPAKLLTEFVANLPGKDTTALQLNEETETLTVTCGRFNANIKGIDHQDFPSLPVVTSGASPFSTAIEAKVLRAALDQVEFATSTDETRPVLTGISSRFEGDSVEFAAADAFRMATRRGCADAGRKEPFAVILPGRAMVELIRSLPNDETEVRIRTTGNRAQILFETDGLMFTSSTIDGTFPNYQQIIPKAYTTRAIVDTAELLRKVKVAALFAKESGNNIVQITVTPGEDLTPGTLSMTAKTDIGDNRSDTDATVEGANGIIALNTKYLSDGLEAVGGHQVVLEFQDATKPMVLKPIGNADDHVQVIMPMHLSNR